MGKNFFYFNVRALLFYNNFTNTGTFNDLPVLNHRTMVLLCYNYFRKKGKQIKMKGIVAGKGDSQWIYL